MDYKREPGYYHNSSLGECEIVYFEDKPHFSESCNWFGPFKTLTDCKKDAIEYHRIDVIDAQGAIKNIRKLKKKDIEVQ